MLRDLATSHNDIGNWLRATDKPEKALWSYQAALDIRKGLADSDRSDREVRGELAETLGNIAVIQFGTGHRTTRSRRATRPG